MLQIETKKSDYYLEFTNDAGEVVDGWEYSGTLEDALYDACPEWCESFAKVTVFDCKGAGPAVCEMYPDGEVVLLVAGFRGSLEV